MLISSTERIELKIYLIFAGLFAIGVGIFMLTEGLFFIALFPVLLGITSIYYASRLCKVKIIENKLQITRNRLTIETPISNIKKVNYRLFMFHLLTEPHIKIKLKEKTRLGKNITFSPSNLTEENDFKFNMKIKRLLENKIEELKNTRANTSA